MGNFNKTFQDLAIHDCKKVSVNVEINASKFARSQEIILNIQCKGSFNNYVGKIRGWGVKNIVNAGFWGKNGKILST